MKTIHKTCTLRSLVLGLLALGAVAIVSRDVGATEKPVLIVPPEQPAFFKITDHDSTIYLFGSMHRILPKTKWRTGMFNDALAKSDRIWLEVTALDSINPALLIKNMQSGRDERPLPDRLSPEMYQRVQAAADKYGVFLNELDGLRIWLVADALRAAADGKDIIVDTNPQNSPKDLKDKPVAASDDAKPSPDTKSDTVAKPSDPKPVSEVIEGAAPPKKRPIRMNAGVEEFLEYEALGRSVKSIEDVAKHYAVFDMMDPETEIAYLTNALDELGKEDNRTFLKKLSATWSRGDLVEIAREDLDKLKPNKGWYKIFIVDRNREMADSIEKQLKNSGTDFFAVGAAHLAGDDSVVKMLKDRNITVTRIYDTKPPYATADIKQYNPLPEYLVSVGLPQELKVSLSKSETNKDKVFVNFIAAKVYNGCGEVTPMLFESKRDEQVVDIRVGPYFFVKPPEIAGLGCGLPSKAPYLDVPLSLKELREYNVNRVRLWFGSTYQNYGLSLNDKTMTLTPPETRKFFKPAKSADLTVTLK
jgi:uncharacterized protein